MKATDLSEMLLVVAHRLHREGNALLAFELLVVEAWKAFPSSFGLHEFEDQYPDAHRVSMEIESLVARGWLMLRITSGRDYQVTPRGRHRAEQVLAATP